MASLVVRQWHFLAADLAPVLPRDHRVHGQLGPLAHIRGDSMTSGLPTMQIESSRCETAGSSINRLQSGPADEQPRAAFQRKFGRPGLRWKFNAVLLPVVAVTVILLVWLDYRHEWQAVMRAHGQHTAAMSAGAAAEPVNRATSPQAVARRTLVIHAVYAVVLLSLVALGLNVALSHFVLKPIDLVRDRIEQMERGYWRMPVQLATQDEVGRVVESFQMLGPKVDALVMQLLRAERLATLALVAKKTASQIEPPVQRIGAAVGDLHGSRDGAVRETAQEIATANAEILAAVRALGRPFETGLRRPAQNCAEERFPADDQVAAARTKRPAKCGAGVQ